MRMTSGAELGQCHAGQRNRDEAGDLDDADAGQRRWGEAVT